MYSDLFVNLYERCMEQVIELKNKAVKIKRVLSPQSDQITMFIETNFQKAGQVRQKQHFIKQIQHVTLL